METFCKLFAILITPSDCKLFPLRSSTVRLVLCDKTAAISSAASLVILLFSNLNCCKVQAFCKPCAILITPSDCKLFPLRLRPVRLKLCDRTAAISSAASLVILLFPRNSSRKVETFCKLRAILITPSDCKLFPWRSSTVRLVVCDKTAATSSAASVVILLFLRNSSCKIEIFCKLFAILITPSDCKLFPLKLNTVSLILFAIIADISSAASLEKLTFSIPNFWRVCKLCAISITPSDWKLFPVRSSTLKLALHDRTAAISSAAFLSIWLFPKYSSCKVEIFCKLCAILVTPLDCKLFPLRFSTFRWVLCDRTAAISSAASSVIPL